MKQQTTLLRPFLTCLSFKFQDRKTSYKNLGLSHRLSIILLFLMPLLPLKMLAQTFVVTSNPFDGVQYGSVAFSDVDGDGDADLLITGVNSAGQRIAKLYANDGNGGYSLVTGTPFEGVSFSSVAFSDVDGDGDADVLITGTSSSGRTAKLYTNDGNGGFSLVVGTPFDGVQGSSVAFSDVDGDGDTDVLITGGNTAGQHIANLYTNDGNGSYSLVSGTPFEGVQYGSVGFSDVDGDGDADVLITGYNSAFQRTAKLYTNDGNGTYNLVAGTPFEGVNDGSLAFSDVDGDGDADILITGFSGINGSIAKLYTNDGNGSYSLVVGTPFEGVVQSSVAFSDVDGDGDADVIITGINSANQRITKLYTNNGNGGFSFVAVTPFDGVYIGSGVFSDVDGDGDADVLITGVNSANQRIANLYTNDGNGVYSLVAFNAFDGVYISSVAFSDVDGDGDADVLIIGMNSASQRTAKLYTNDGNGIYSLVVGTPFENVYYGSVAFSDVDGDGDADVLITGLNYSDQYIAKLYTNDGNGDYSLVAGTPFDGVNQGSLAFSDVDGDGDADVLITGWNNSGRTAKLYTNDGNGGFSLVAGTPFDAVSYSSVAFSDVDGDGDADVLITGENIAFQRIAKLYINDGNGAYSLVAGTPFDGVYNGSVSFSDVDGDGDADVLITGNNSANQRTAKLYANDGNGGFSLVAGTPFEGVQNSYIAFTDVDGDGDADVFITGQSAVQRTAKLYANDGNGGYSLVAGTPFDAVSYSSVAFSDVDGDGDADVMITGQNSTGQRIAKLYRNTTSLVDTPPTAVCQDIAVQLDANGNVTIQAADVDNGSSDLEGPITLTLDMDTFDCSNLGANTVTLTVTDNTGQSSTCTATVTVEDNEAPTAVCMYITVELDANGTVTILPSDVDGGSTDNCAITSMSLSKDTFTCADLTIIPANPVGCPVDVSYNDTPTNANTGPNGQTFVAQISGVLEKIDVTTAGTMQIRIREYVSTDLATAFTGTILGTSNSATGNFPNLTTFTFPAPPLLMGGSNYIFEVVGGGGTAYHHIPGGYADGTAVSGSNPGFVRDIPFITYMCPVSVASTILTITDAAGNSANCIANVIVKDNLAPSITCPADITQSNDAGSCGAVVNYTVTTSDNCAGVTTVQTAGLASGSSFPVGTTTNTFEVTDASGNTSNCSFDVTINDIEDPIITCPADITQTNDAGMCNAVVTYTVTTSDNCVGEILTQTAGLPSGSAFPVGTTTNTFEVMDASGNTATCSFDITVEDTEAPVANCAAPFTIQLDTNGNASITVADIDNGATDNCGIASLTFSETLTAFAEANEGQILTITLPGGAVVEWVDFASYGNPNGSNGNYTIGGCHTTNSQAIVESYALGNNSFTIPATNTVFGDPCGGTFKRLYVAVSYTVIETTETFTCSNVGDNTVTLTVTDVNGNVSTCTTEVTVEDNVAPIANCAAPFTIQLDPNGNASITVADIENGSTDACGIASTTIDIDTFDCSNVGDNTVTLTVTDVNGNVSTCTTVVTVEDNVAPIANCAAPFTIQLDANGNASITVADIDNGSTDVCGIASTTIDMNTFDCSHVGDNTVTLTVTDVNGNVSTCTTVVTVEDNIVPIATCAAPFTIQLDANGNASITVADIDNGSSDACGIASTTIDITDFDCSNVGDNTVTLTVTDVNGNVSTCTTVVTVEDNVAPIANCAAPFTIQLDPNGNASITVADIENGSTDACGIASTTIDIDTFDCSNVGSNTVTLTVTDVYGNVSTCTTVVTVEDNVAPVVNCAAPFTIQLDANGNASITVADIDNGSSDTCGIASTTIDITDFDCSNVGDNTVTLTVTDVNGNVSTCTTIVTVEDNVVPIANCAAPFIIQLDANGNASITVADIDNGSSDACGIASTTIDITDFDCSNVGDNTVTLTVTDVNGNVSTCTTVVTVEDNVAPMANCAAPFTIQLDANGNASINVADIDNGSTDACGIASTTIDIDTFDCSLVGDNTVTLTITDINGNLSTCTTVVTVEDNVAPIANCAAPFTIQLDANGNASITVADIDNGSTDACGIASTIIDIDTFDCSHVGPNNVILTVTDNNGNISTCTAIVTVEDSIAPTIVCPANITANTDPGVCSATVSFPAAIAVDNCGVASVVQTAGLPSGSAFPVGINSIEFTATDVNGNTSVCSFTITVIDNESAIAVCQDITIQLDASGNASITAADVDGGSTDNCGVATTTIDMSTFNCSNVGTNNVTLTVTDVNGNVSTCIAVVTVEDVTAPVVTCQDITVQLDTNGMVTITGTDIDYGSTDACGIIAYDLDIDTFDCSNLGENIVTLTVTDANGNIASCTATVTVEDITSPVLVCQDYTLELGADGTAILLPGDVIANNDDACGIYTIAVDITEFDCSDIGTPVFVQVFTQDNNGNLATCYAMVTVVDVLAPVITCPGNQTVDTGLGNLFYDLPDYFASGEATAMDNCTEPVITTTQDPVPGTLLTDGVYTITLTAEDEYGNTSNCSFELIVESILRVNDNPLTQGSVQLYPNPAKDVITLGNPQLMELEQAFIYDLTGKLVQTINLEGMGATMTINVKYLSSATYIVMIKGKTGQITKRLVKK